MVKICHQIYIEEKYKKMKLTKYNNSLPSTAPSLFNDMFDVFNHPFFTKTFGNVNSISLNTDVFEADGNFNIVCEVPGLNKEDIAISYDKSNRFVTITAKSSYEKFEEKPNFHVRERSIGQNVRNFRVPSYVDAEKMSSTIIDGVLKISAPIAETSSDVVRIAID